MNDLFDPGKDQAQRRRPPQQETITRTRRILISPPTTAARGNLNFQLAKRDLLIVFSGNPDDSGSPLELVIIPC